MRTRPRDLARGLLALLPLVTLTACGDMFDMDWDLSLPPAPVVACADLRASELSWSLLGFNPSDIVDPNNRSATELTAQMWVDQTVDLKLFVAYLKYAETTGDCLAKATAIEWVSTSPEVARLDVAGDSRSARLVGVSPGETRVFAILTFADGTPPLRALPNSSTNVGSGNVTLVRVVR